MTYYCKLCDKKTDLKSKHEHFKSKNHKYLEEIFIMRYFVENPDITQINELLKKFVNIYIKKCYFNQIRCVIKVLTNTNDIQNLKIKPILNVVYRNNPNILSKKLPCFYQIFEMRILFISNHSC